MLVVKLVLKTSFYYNGRILDPNTSFYQCSQLSENLTNLICMLLKWLHFTDSCCKGNKYSVKFFAMVETPRWCGLCIVEKLLMENEVQGWCIETDNFCN